MLVVFDKLNNTLVLVGKVKLNCNLVVVVDVYSINQFYQKPTVKAFYILMFQECCQIRVVASHVLF